MPEPASSPCQAPPGYWDAENDQQNTSMPPPVKRTVLFLGAVNDDRGRAAEAQFNGVAARMGLPWAAVSRAPEAVTAADFETAVRVVSLDRANHEPILREQYPDRVAAVEYWQVAAGDAAAVEREVLGLVTHLLGGRMDAREVPPAPEPPKKVLTAKVGRETAGRKGKGVTTVFGLPLSEAELLDLAGKLKQRCGTGGTVKDGRIEIQGDNRDRVMAELVKLGFQVKRAGG
jgi:translation initiation factor 1